LPLDKAETLMKIPALPISYGDAQPFLEALAGQVAPKAWRGALPVTYHVGPGPARAHLVVKSDWSLKPLYDVIAVMPGAERPDEWVIRANHRDGWVFGAWDPLSGQAAMLEEARSIGALAKTGWKPKAHHRLCQLGRRGAGSAGLQRVGRGACRRAARQGPALRELRQQHPRRIGGRRQLRHAAAALRGRRGREGSRNRRQRQGAGRRRHAGRSAG